MQLNVCQSNFLVFILHKKHTSHQKSRWVCEINEIKAETFTSLKQIQVKKNIISESIRERQRYCQRERSNKNRVVGDKLTDKRTIPRYERMREIFKS